MPFPGRAAMIVGGDFFHPEPRALPEFRWQDNHWKIRVQRMGEVDDFDRAAGDGQSEIAEEVGGGQRPLVLDRKT